MIFSELQEIISSNPNINKPNTFYTFLLRTYSTFMLMGIRRLMKPQKDSVTLIGLLEDIKGSPELLSRDRWISNFAIEKGSDETRNLIILNYANKGFDNLAGKINKYIEPSMVAEDIYNLDKKTCYLEKYIDRRIAHFDARKKITIPSWNELNDCVDIIGDIFNKYYTLIRCGSYIQLHSEIIGNWKAIFRVPWIINNPPLKSNPSGPHPP